MRIWSEQLIPKLCRQHILGMWREMWGAYIIITQNKQGYRNHPATQEFINCPDSLWLRLYEVRQEMLKRGYNPKELPPAPPETNNFPNEWQSLDEQIKVLKAKKCKCVV